MRFRDRREAGRILASRLHYLCGHDPIVVGLSPGGVIVARQIADALVAPLDVLLVHKIRAPGFPGAAIGAIGEQDVVVRNQRIIRALRITPAAFRQAARSAKADLVQRAARYHPGHRPLPVAGRPVVLVDDGIVTGATARAAVRVLRARQAGRIILAVPVAPLEVLRSLSRGVDQTICTLPLVEMTSLGAWYTDFSEVDESQVPGLLTRREAEMARR
ncbi:phosphoribosyltransferase family protein [Amycolatopsis mongoliensis]|uniref:Phosphoribosyltransferase family protein n=1 Tax=Amycolatopsis mongoliensis TaxID=715475 RepID=A0A9Y2JHU5_9PSEU|nr:phosphoribosyltransferase family protein [Amycolatopsis sp. 4-36]WIX98342.1 phosphoribosyltransferase family protein [Amycolatopsis sp. 4-36]